MSKALSHGELRLIAAILAAEPAEQTVRLEELHDAPAPDAANPEWQATESEKARKIRQSLSRIGPRYAKAIRLRFLDEMPLAAIAAEFRLSSESGARMAVARALEEMRKDFARHGITERRHI